jgi:hypothetical protein
VPPVIIVPETSYQNNDCSVRRWMKVINLRDGAYQYQLGAYI